MSDGSPTLAGTWTLVRVALRRDRIQLLSWIVGLSGFVGFSAFSLRDQFGDESSRASRAELMSNPTLRALRGPGYGLDDYTVPAMVTHELLLFALIGMALMTILMVTRHLRAVEEDGRWELVAAAVFGRHAGVAAAGIVTIIASVATAATTAAALVGVGGGEIDVTDAAVFGLAMALTGVVFAAVSLVASQIAAFSRGANAIGLAALCGAFVLRAVGDRGGPDDRHLSWLSPLGWAQSMRPGASEQLWPIALLALSTVTLTAVAVVVGSRRGIGSGIVTPGPGPSSASSSLLCPSGFAWRLQRTALAGWTLGAVAMAAPFGAIIGDIDVFLDQNPQLADIFGGEEGDLLGGFLGTVYLIIGLVAAAAAVHAVLRLRTEEQTLRAELYLSTPTSRGQWMRSHVVWSLVAGSVSMAIGVAALAAAAAIEQRSTDQITQITTDGLTHLPAIWFFTLITATTWWFIPRAVNVCWLLVAYAAFIEVLGEALGLPAPVRAVSPFHHLDALTDLGRSWAIGHGYSAGSE